MFGLFKSSKDRASLGPGQKGLFLMDQLTELFSGLGGATDRMAKVKYEAPTPVSKSEVEWAYQFDGIIERYVTRPVEDGLAEGVEFPSLSDEEVKFLENYLKKVEFWPTVEMAWTTARMNKGSAIWLDTNSNQPAAPMGMREARRFREFVVFDSDALHAVMRSQYHKPHLWQTGEPSVPGQAIHPSRLLIFPGKFVSQRHTYHNLGWGACEVDRVWKAFIHYLTAYLTPAQIALTYEEGIYYMENFNQMMASAQGKKSIKNKIFDIEAARSYIRQRIVDAKDKYERKGAPVSGLDKVLDKAKEHLQATTGWPHTILFGESPGSSIGGSGAGNSQKEDWQRIVFAEQERNLRPVFEKYFDFIRPDLQRISGLPFKSMEFTFPPILQESKKERADREKVEADTAKTYVDMHAFSEDEIRDNAIKKGVYSVENTELPEYDEAEEETQIS